MPNPTVLTNGYDQPQRTMSISRGLASSRGEEFVKKARLALAKRAKVPKDDRRKPFVSIETSGLMGGELGRREVNQVFGSENTVSEPPSAV